MVDFGINGRLGNQMFQYAFLYSIAHNSDNTILKLPKPNNPESDKQTYQLETVFDMKIEELTMNDYKNLKLKLRERIEYDEDPSVDVVKNTRANASFSGYVQCWKYFHPMMKKQIINQFKFKSDVVKKAEEALLDMNIVYNTKLVSLHVRRGDYIGNIHYVPDIAYYRAAALYIKGCMEGNGTKLHFVVFSDDIDWCKEHITSDTIGNVSITYSSNSHGVDLFLMSHCDAHIIAASSFSWWGAYLADSNMVIAPSKWFNERATRKYNSFNKRITANLLLPGWITI